MAEPARSRARSSWPVAALAVFLTAEIGLRASGWQAREPEAPPFRYEPDQDPLLRAGDGLHAASVRELWVPAPGAEIPWQRGEHVDASGCRGSPLGPPVKGVLRIAAVGDGNTFGAGVSLSECWCTQLARRLAESGTPAEVLDAGVLGFSAEQSFQRYLEVVRPAAPELVLLVVTGVEEARPSDLVTDRARIALSLGRARGWSFVADEPQDVRALAWLQDHVPGFEPVKTDPKFLEDFLERRRMRMANDLEQSGRPDWPGTRRVPIPEFEECLRRFVRQARADGSEPWLVCMPRPPELDAARPVLARYDDTLRIVARDERAGVVDGGAFFVDVVAGGTEPGRLFAGEQLSALGHARMAEELAHWITAERRR